MGMGTQHQTEELKKHQCRKTYERSPVNLGVLYQRSSHYKQYTFSSRIDQNLSSIFPIGLNKTKSLLDAIFLNFF